MARRKGAPPRRTLEDLTDNILMLKDQMSYSFIEIGKLLIEVKKQITKHREWVDWLNNDVHISAQMAERYMKVAREYTDSSLVLNLGITKALMLLQIPKEDRGQFINATHDVEGVDKKVIEMTVRELQLTIHHTLHPEEDDNPYPHLQSPKDIEDIEDENVQNSIYTANFVLSHYKYIANMIGCDLNKATLMQVAHAVDIVKEMTSTEEYNTYNFRQPQLLLVLEVWNALKTGQFVKRCKRCGKPFITPDKRVVYCNRVDKRGHRCGPIKGRKKDGNE